MKKILILIPEHFRKRRKPRPSIRPCSHPNSRLWPNPHSALAGWKGFLQADAYQGYNALYAGDIVEAACWAHTRRKYLEAEKSDRRATGVLGLIQNLYRVEKHIKGVCSRLGWSFDSPGEDGDKAEEFRRRRRAKKSIPISPPPSGMGLTRGDTCVTYLTGFRA